MPIFRWIYTILVHLLLPVALLKLLWRSRQNKAYGQHWNERFGFVRLNTSEKIIWIHAVSVGETIAIRPLVDALLVQYPTHKILLTHGTINGRIRAEALFGDKVLHSYAPYDLPFMVDQFLKNVQPVLVLIMETEVWPNWMRALKLQEIPVILVNARLSERSYRRYARFSGLFRKVWQSFTMIAAQAAPDANRYVLLGVEEKKVQVAGNLKYNLKLSDSLFAQIEVWRKKIEAPQVWIAASTHPGEEVQLLKVYAELKKTYPQLLWILVPRHPERAQSIEKLCQDASWQVLLRSELGAAPLETIRTDILLVDTIGELLLFYALAQVAFVGGSFISQGGHNILEPAALGTAITCGPWMFNFSTMLEQFKNACALIQCDDLNVLIRQTLTLFAEEPLRLKYIEAAKKCFSEEQQALPNHLALIKSILE